MVSSIKGQYYEMDICFLCCAPRVTQFMKAYLVVLCNLCYRPLLILRNYLLMLKISAENLLKFISSFICQFVSQRRLSEGFSLPVVLVLLHVAAFQPLQRLSYRIFLFKIHQGIHKKVKKTSSFIRSSENISTREAIPLSWPFIDAYVTSASAGLMSSNYFQVVKRARCMHTRVAGFAHERTPLEQTPNVHARLSSLPCHPTM
jgi:hypothetical protein